MIEPLKQYRCNKCKAEFSEHEIKVFTYKEYMGEFWGSPAYETFYEYHCPECGSEDFEEREDEDDI